MNNFPCCSLCHEGYLCKMYLFNLSEAVERVRPDLMRLVRPEVVRLDRPEVVRLDLPEVVRLDLPEVVW